MAMGDRHKLPAGGALAVDRDGFAAAVTRALEAEPLVTLVREEVQGCRRPGGARPSSPPGRSPRRRWRRTSGGSAARTSSPFSTRSPRSSTRRRSTWSRLVPVALRQGGPGGGGADYVNCPLDRDQYEAFVDALLAAEKAEFKDWERSTPYFEGCLPIEVMAERGRRRCASGPMKPWA